MSDRFIGIVFFLGGIAATLLLVGACYLALKTLGPWALLLIAPACFLGFPMALLLLVRTGGVVFTGDLFWDRHS